MSRHQGDPFDVAIVGGGPAGSALAIRLARAGCSVLLLERSTRWRWRACGVFASPIAMAELTDLGLDRSTLERVGRTIPAMRVETRQRTAFRLTYGAADDGTGGAVGFDRGALDEALLELARSCGATVARGSTVRSLDASSRRDSWNLVLEGRDASSIRAGTVVGADGIRSVVARAIGVARPARSGRRIGLTWHIPDPAGPAPHEARMVLLDGAYCGVAPVPGGRLNVGVVLWGRDRLRTLRTRGAEMTGRAILDEVRALDGAMLPVAPDVLDAIAGAVPVGHRVHRRAGFGWLLVGDAAGFLDPFTGEGLSRALVSARYAARIIADQAVLPADLTAYDRAMQQRFATKDLVSLIVQAFVARPAMFEYAAKRLASRASLRETLGMVIGDQLPASRALDPRYVASLLAP